MVVFSSLSAKAVLLAQTETPACSHAATFWHMQFQGAEKQPGSYPTIYLFLYITHSQTELLAEMAEKPNWIINVSYGVVYL